MRETIHSMLWPILFEQWIQIIEQKQNYEKALFDHSRPPKPFKQDILGTVYPVYLC